MRPVKPTPKQGREIKRLEAIILQARNEIHAIRAPLEDAYAQAFVGMHFRFRNTYGGEKPKHWYGYIKVLRLVDGGLTCLRFEQRPDCVLVHPEEWISTVNLERGHEAISPDEFGRQWRKVLKALDKLG